MVFQRSPLGTDTFRQSGSGAHDIYQEAVLTLCEKVESYAKVLLHMTPWNPPGTGRKDQEDVQDP